MSTNSWQQKYAFLFVLVVLSSLLWTMFKSLNQGIPRMEDSFFEKARLINLYNRLRYSMGDRVFSQVLIGKEGWMEYIGDGNFEAYQNIAIVPERLESTYQKLDALYQELSQRNITLIVVVAPNKSTIYPDKVADSIQKAGDKSRLDVFLEIAKRGNSPYVIDLRPAMIQARRDHQLYYQTDTHWNSLGAYIAYREIMNFAAQTHPELQPYELDQFRWKQSDPQPQDLPKLMGVNFIREPRDELQPKFDSTAYLENFHPLSRVSMSWARGQQATLLMYHDSFGYSLQPFLQHHFKQATYIHHSHGDLNVSDMSWIDTIHPDIVILEIVERGLPQLEALLSSP